MKQFNLLNPIEMHERKDKNVEVDEDIKSQFILDAI